MSNRDLTTRFGADTSGFSAGVSEVIKKLDEYNKALIDNQSQIKKVNRETTELEKEQKKLAEKIKSNTATEEEKARYSDLTSEIEKHRLQLAQLRTDQTNIKNAISETNTELKDASDKAMQAAKSNVSLKDSLNQTKTAAKDTTRLIAEMTAAISAAITALFAFEKSSAQWADDLNTLSKTTSISTAELQKFEYASNLIDVDISTLTGSLTKLVRNMQSASAGTGTAYEAFKKLDISVTDGNGTLRDRQEVFYELIDALGKVTNETERDTLAMNVFGRSAQELNPLIEGGAEALKELGDEAERAGLILSQSALDNLNAFNDKVDTLAAKGTQIKALAAEQLTPALDGLLEVADDLLADVQKMIDSGELEQIAKDLGQVIKSLAEDLKNLLKFVWENKEAITGVVSAMVAFKAATSVGTLVNSLCTAFKSLTTATQGATVAQEGLNTAMSINPVILLMSAISALTIGLLSYWKAAEEAKAATYYYGVETKNCIESIEQAKEAVDKSTASVEAEGQKIKMLADEYETLRSKTVLTAKDKMALDKVAAELAQSLGKETAELKDQNGQYIDMSENIDKYIAAKKREAEATAVSNLLTKAYEERAELEVLKADAEKALKDYAEEIRSGAKQDDNKVKTLKDTWSDYVIQLNAVNQTVEKYSEKYKNVIKQQEQGNDTSAYALELAERQAQAQEKLSSATDSLIASESMLASAEKEVESNGKLSLNTLNSMCKQYPILTDLVNEYILGVKTEKDVIDGLKNVYENDKNNYTASVKAKVILTSDFYNNLLKNNANYVNDCKSKYDLDLQNFASVEQAKIAIKANAEAQKRAELVKTAWIEENSSKQLLTYDPIASITGQPNMRVDAVQNEQEKKRQQQFAIIDQAAKEAGDSAARDFQQMVDSYYKGTYSASVGTSISTSISTPSSSSSSSTGSSTGGTSSDTTALKAYQDKLNLAYEAYNKLVSDRIELIEEESKAAQKAADKEIAAIDKQIEARKRLNADRDRQKELDAINAQLAYAQLDELSRRELERKRQDLLDEQAEVDWERQMTDKKAAIQSGLSETQEKNNEAMNALRAASESAKSYFDKLAGTQSNSQIVNNNSDTRNIQIVQNALNDQQMVNKLLKAIYDQ